MSRAGTSPTQDVLDAVRALNNWSERAFLNKVELDMLRFLASGNNELLQTGAPLAPNS